MQGFDFLVLFFLLRKKGTHCTEEKKNLQTNFVKATQNYRLIKNLTILGTEKILKFTKLVLVNYINLYAS